MNDPKWQRNTPQRRIILQELRKVRSHPTAVELYGLVRRQLPKISLGTVYRNLERLAASGSISKLELTGTEARFDGDPAPHYHVRCVQCGRVADVPGHADVVVENHPEEAAGYEILGHRLEFMGICPNCRSPSTKEPGENSGDITE